MQQTEHLHVSESTLSYKHQQILDAQFHPKVLGNLYSQDFSLKAN